MTSDTSHTDVHRSLGARHLVMLALGGVIGSGLFISSGYTITQAGPLGTVIAYLVGALIAWMVMACLGELAVQYPESGGFHVYAYRAISPAAGFTTAWLYWLCWVAALGSELTASGLLMQRWFPDVEVWVFCLVFAGVLFAINAVSVRGFGETEFWLSLIKVAAIVVLIVVGFAAIAGLGPREATGLSNFVTDDGLFPTGASGVFITILAVFYAFSGTELIAIAAGETRDPHTTIPRALKATLLRLVVFFVGAIFVIAALIPFDRLKEIGGDESVENSPFVLVFDLVGIPYAGDIMAVVIIVALLSAGNSGLYACSRLMYSMARAGQLPAAFGRTTAQGVPLLALSVSLAGGLIALVSSVVSPGAVYLALVSIAGFAVVAVWMVIIVSQMRLRATIDPTTLSYSTPGYPVVPIVALVACSLSLVAVAFDPNQVAALYFGIPFVLVCWGVHYVTIDRRGRRSPEA
ncbi:amino acid permease [Corynebacterium uterequi]|uniref:Amino acid transporter n=1 Tax=Corynebacterium uterequi TaxID=1072256 RepID=A0A0G3HII0_9CORY|nr:amino acid permease [Corynebacterium uterequi]AKK10967.1 amino acid transporter [Corynebacterium uterequi]